LIEPFSRGLESLESRTPFQRISPLSIILDGLILLNLSIHLLMGSPQSSLSRGFSPKSLVVDGLTGPGSCPLFEDGWSVVDVSSVGQSNVLPSRHPSKSPLAWLASTTWMMLLLFQCPLFFFFKQLPPPSFFFSSSSSVLFSLSCRHRICPLCFVPPLPSFI